MCFHTAHGTRHTAHRTSHGYMSKVGADITKVSQAEYSEQGGDALIARTCQKLAAAGHRPYGIRVGGSDSLGLWGYLNAASV